LEWSKVKTILIFVLLGVNLFMLCSLINTLQGERAIRKEALETAVRVVNGDGLDVRYESVPADAKGIAAYEIPRDEAAEAEIASKLIGEYTLASPGADTTVYHGQNGEATFRSSGNFEIKITGDFSVPQSKDEATEAARKLINSTGIKAMRDSCTFEDGEYVVHFKQGLQKNEIVNSDIEVCFFEDSVTLTGIWAFGSPLSTGEMPRDSAELLLEFKNVLKEQNLLPKKILSVEAGYVAGAATGGRLKLQPVWAIECEGVGLYYFDVVRALPVAVEYSQST